MSSSAGCTSTTWCGASCCCSGWANLYLAEIGTARTLDWLSQLMALLYGVGAALTLDEFALWLRLEDVYWAREGRESIDARACARAN